MGLLLIILGLVSIAVAIIALIKDNPNYLYSLLLLPALFPLSSIGEYPPDSLKYQADIHMGGDQNNTPTAIYFSEFIQRGNTIEIQGNYAVFPRTHLLDFKKYDINNSPLSITLSDNAGKFIYYDRVNHITYNENMVASQ